MRKLYVLFALGLLLSVLSTESFADIRTANTQKALGGANTGNAVLSTTGQRVTGVFIASTASAGIISVYNASTLGTATNANLVLEIGAPANDSKYVDLTNNPIDCPNGVTIVQSNSNGGGVYAVQ